MVYYYCKGRPPKGEKDMKKIEKMTYAQASAYLKELKQQAIQRTVEKTLDFFKENVKEPLTFRELVSIGYNEFETPQTFSTFVHSHMESYIHVLCKPTYIIACDKNGVPYKDAQPIEQCCVNAYKLLSNFHTEGHDMEIDDDDDWDDDWDDDDDLEDEDDE